MIYEYRLDNFLSTPNGDDSRLRIYDKNGNFKYNVIPDISHYFVKNNCMIIKMTNENDIILNFQTRQIAIQALSKLDTIKKLLLSQKENLDPRISPTLNILNRYMAALHTTADYQLACNTPILHNPKSIINITVTSGMTTIPVYAGVPDDVYIGCYFTSVNDNGDPTKARVNDGDVQKGDLLYWIGSVTGFELDILNIINFEYLF